MEITKPVILDETGREIVNKLNEISSRMGRGGVVYGFFIDGDISNPSTNVTYLKDAVGMTPAHMNYQTGKFDNGSWGDAFFMPRPCMLKRNGMVDYYLDPNNYAKKEDGTSSDIANAAYDGNAMMEWGQNGRKIWTKIVPANGGKSASIFIADYNADGTFTAFPFLNNQGRYVDHFYTPIYTGSLDSNNCLRSLSGTTNIKVHSGTEEITYAKANNKTSDVIWHTEVFCDIQLIDFLLVLIGKSTNTQATFGNGYYTGGSEATMLKSGTMNDKGLFWGSNGSSAVGVKVFGMENWWGNQWRRYAGHMMIGGEHRYKLTYTSLDGSTASEYNTSGNGYLSSGISPTGTSGGYISEMGFTEDGMFPKVVSGGSNTNYCDGHWFAAGTTYAYRGGACDNGLLAGAFCLRLNTSVGGAAWNIGASLSCKPLA